MKLNEKLNKARINRGYTQLQLAEKVGASQATINKLEGGKIGSPSFELAIKIANALQIDVYELFGDGSIKNPVNSESEKDKLKILVFHSLERYVSNRIFFSSGEYDENTPEHQTKFNEYKKHLEEFKKGMYEMLVNVGFCTHEEIKAFKLHINPNKKK
jgi:DNA-binding XRE family transcriptional regulator